MDGQIIRQKKGRKNEETELKGGERGKEGKIRIMNSKYFPQTISTACTFHISSFVLTLCTLLHSSVSPLKSEGLFKIQICNFPHTLSKCEITQIQPRLVRN